MSFGFIASHYPAPEHLDEFVASCHEVADTARLQPGFESVGVWVSTDGDAVITTGAFESEEAFQAAAAIGRQRGAAARRYQRPGGQAPRGLLRPVAVEAPRP